MKLKRSRKKKIRIFMNTIDLIFKHCFLLLLGEGLFLGFSIFILAPFMPFVLDLTLSVSHYSYITINNIVNFMLNPITIIMFIILFFIIGLFLLFQAAYLITFYSIIENGNTPKLFHVYILSLRRLFLAFKNKNFKLLPIVWLTMILSNIPLLLFTVKNVRIFRFIADSIVENHVALPIIIIFSILSLLTMLRKLPVFQYCVVESRSYKEALVKSKKMKKKRALRSVFYFIVWNMGISLIIYTIYICTMIVAAFFVIGIPDKTLVIATFISMNEKMSGYLAIGIFAFSTIANYGLFTHLFFQYKKEANEYFIFDDSVDNAIFKVKSYKRVIILVITIITISNIYFLYNIIRNGYPFVYENLEMIKITSHRGFSHKVPENTILAIEKAIEEQADFVEIDVRQTKDGELILLHDENLKRTTGLNKVVWNTDYAEITLLDAGLWMGDAFIGIKIPTLREVFELCKGKVNLNLDLKYDSHIDGLEEKIVALIDEYDMELQCVISSTSLLTLEKVKILNPNIRTGYITHQVYQGYYNNENIDFFSVKSYFISEKVIQEIHKNGKKLHVWTVNTKNELERMKRLGVDNIITDNPAYSKEILFQEESNRVIVTLIKIMISY